MLTLWSVYGSLVFFSANYEDESETLHTKETARAIPCGLCTDGELRR